MRHIAASLLLSILICFQSQAQHSGNVKLLCNWNDTTNCAVNLGGQHWNDVWGFTVKGKEYAVIGGTSGAHIIDIDSCVERAYLPTQSTGVVHRDYKTYNNYLYCVSDEGHFSAMMVYDLSTLPDSATLVWSSPVDTLYHAHNIFIDTAKAKLYCAAPKRSGPVYPLSVFSLANPARPRLICEINAGMQSVHDVYARNDTAWISDGFNGYIVMDMSKLPNYRILGGLSFYAFKGYNHSSWVGYDYIGVMADETFGMSVKVIDAHDPSVINVLSTFSPRALDSTCMPHNPYLLGHYALISYYQDGLQIYDLTDPRNPRQAGYFDTYPGPNQQQYAGAWGCYPYLPSGRILVSDMQTGLYVFDVSEALKPVLDVDAVENKDTRMQVFPVPAGNSLSIQLPADLSGTTAYCVIYDFNGCAVTAATALQLKNDGRVDLSLPASLAPGMYMLRAAIGGQSFTARFTKR